jgi:hypothetical protein
MRKQAMVLLAVGLVLFGALVALVGPRQCLVSEAACNRIKVGMTQAEVEEILGGPPGDYKTRPRDDPELFDLTNTDKSVVFTECKEWSGDEGRVFVRFSIGTWDGTPIKHAVVQAMFEPAEPQPISLVGLALWRLNRFKDRLLP